jgi:two-component system cell cycle response regulator CtrA
MRVLLVEADSSAAANLAEFLAKRGIQTEVAYTGEEALDLLRHYDFDVMVLHLALPDMDGCSLIARMRAARKATPVLALSGLSSPQIRLKALNTGADDAIHRLTDREEVLARMRSIVRRSCGHSRPVLQVGAVALDLEQGRVLVGETEVNLTGKEFAILQLLMMRKNMVLTKDTILSQVYGGMDEPELKIIDVFVCKIRSKLAKAGVTDHIGTVWGRGYTVRDVSRDTVVPSPINVPRPAQPVPDLLLA